MMMSSNNSTSSMYCLDVFISDTPKHRYAMNIALIVINCPFAVFAVLSNALVLFLVIRTRELHTPSNILLCSLAITDLLVGLITQPLMITWRVMVQNLSTTCTSKVIHIWYEAFLFISTGGSFLTLTFISYDRFLAVSKPVRYSSRVSTSNILRKLAFLWLLWIIFVILKYSLFTENINQTINTTFAVVLLATLLTLQIATIRYIRINNDKIISDHNAKVIYDREKRATITIMFVLGALVVFLLPTVIVQTAIGFSDATKGIIAANFAMTAILMNSSANPLIYFWRNREIRKNCLKFFRCSNDANVINIRQYHGRHCTTSNTTSGPEMLHDTSRSP
ncbi:histamine H2 receptor-like [Actinia tenebrosa]|uniref:Histamine H2 receptor-like n=1 Tax=Actinia tenebrosa TaxID=6105 RepID=A0A6P8J9E2_ACTTE|nr:histamine H2 receptor-like [Actinia tenebrosa]XP_031573476.1 histamine H2 receptor-like [Actinia tenebrosa]XP_031573477.1 histamine H2 receptor-like [Actinia tenebrosa]